MKSHKMKLNGVIHVLYIWLSLSALRIIHVACRLFTFSPVYIPLYEYPHLSSTAVDENWGCSQFGAVMSNGRFCEHAGNMLIYMGMHSVSCIPRSRVVESESRRMLKFNIMPGSFPKCLHHFILPPMVYESSCCSVPLPTLGIISLKFWLLWWICINVSFWF